MCIILGISETTTSSAAEPRIKSVVVRGVQYSSCGRPRNDSFPKTQDASIGRCRGSNMALVSWKRSRPTTPKPSFRPLRRRGSTDVFPVCRFVRPDCEVTQMTSCRGSRYARRTGEGETSKSIKMESKVRERCMGRRRRAIAKSRAVEGGPVAGRLAAA